MSSTDNALLKRLKKTAVVASSVKSFEKERYNEDENMTEMPGLRCGIFTCTHEVDNKSTTTNFELCLVCLKVHSDHMIRAF